jgi:hypothetical protein
VAFRGQTCAESSAAGNPLSLALLKLPADAITAVVGLLRGRGASGERGAAKA